jgi:hypothetical protein
LYPLITGWFAANWLRCSGKEKVRPEKFDGGKWRGLMARQKKELELKVVVEREK